MGKSGRKEAGQKLSQPDFVSLVERWLDLFGAYPSDDTETGDAVSGGTAVAYEAPEPARDAMLSPRDVVRQTGLSLSTVKRMVNDGRFPKPRRLSPRRIGWPAAEVRDWLRALDEQSRATRQ